MHTVFVGPTLQYPIPVPVHAGKALWQASLIRVCIQVGSEPVVQLLMPNTAGILSRCRRFTQCGLGLDGSLSSYKRQRQRQLLPEARLFKLTASEDAGWGFISAQPTTLAHLRDVTTKSNTFPGFEHSVRQLRLQFLATLCRSRSSTTMPVSWSALAT